MNAETHFLIGLALVGGILAFIALVRLIEWIGEPARRRHDLELARQNGFQALVATIVAFRRAHKRVSRALRRPNEAVREEEAREAQPEAGKDEPGPKGTPERKEWDDP